jgi:hypothetical protein
VQFSFDKFGVLPSMSRYFKNNMLLLNKQLVAVLNTTPAAISAVSAPFQMGVSVLQPATALNLTDSKFYGPYEII